MVSEHGHYLMQLRDHKANIYYPGHWGLFGGAVDEGEKAEDGLRRELIEELNFDPGEVKPFVSFDFDLSHIGGKKVYRTFYEVPVKESEVQNFVLGEGLKMHLFDAPSLLLDEKVTPYDSFAIWLHANHHRLDMKP